MKIPFKKYADAAAAAGTADAGAAAPAVDTSSKKDGAVRKFFKKLRPKGKKGWVLLIIIVLLIAAGVVAVSRHSGTANASDDGYVTDTVQYRDISSSITGSGTLEAANQYSVKSLVGGTILSDTFEEGDTVAQDTVLYNIDSSDSTTSLQQAELSLEQAERSYSNAVSDQADLTITSPSAGQVISFDVEVGDDVKSGDQVATVRDSSSMTLKVYFPADDAESMYAGQTATVTLDSTFETLSGTVTNVSQTDTVLTGNLIVREVTISVKNPGGISTSQSATASVGSATSTSSGTFEYKAEKKVTAEVSGTVSKIYVSEGATVTAGQTLIKLTSEEQNDSVQNAADSLENAKLQLEEANKKLDDYTITSPIQGTVIDKAVKAGEKIEANTELCTIYDLSYLEMTLSVDELDISNIEVGQTVKITADAVEDKEYEGVVTKVSVAGTTDGSATTYPVTIQIDETDGLLPGMNVDAEISLESADHVLSIPSAALQRGNTVLVPSDGTDSDTGDASATAGAEADAAAGNTEAAADSTTSGNYKSVTVETGISDGTYIQIISGLEEGDTIAYLPSTSSSDESIMMPGGGEMPSGGGAMPSGGGGGGAPSGGGGGFPG